MAPDHRDSGRPKLFDLVELTEAVGERPAGVRGTVAVEADDHALVDFAWIDGFLAHRPESSDIGAVPYEAMRRLERPPRPAGPRCFP